MRRPRLFLVALLATAAASAAAQSDRASRFMDNCRRNGGDDERFCETRTLTAGAVPLLRVDGRSNGGIAVHGWDRGDIQILAMVQANAGTEAEAREIARGVSVVASGGEVRAEGPSTGRRESWSVSYDIYVPRTTNLTLTANNGGVSIESMASTIVAEPCSR